jgi:hypothetical protein
MKFKKNFNLDEVRHLSGNYAIYSLKGGELSFDEWYHGIDTNWRNIANRKKSISEKKYEKKLMIRMHEHIRNTFFEILYRSSSDKNEPIPIKNVTDALDSTIKEIIYSGYTD